MTIDERLEKLTERHEALAQAMELNASLQRDHDQRMGQAIEALSQGIETLANVQANNERRIDKLVNLHAENERHMVGMMDAITRLSNIVADHDIRLDNLESRA